MLLPFAASPEHAPDTVFIIREADFCFNEEDAKAHEEYIAAEEEKAMYERRRHDNVMADHMPNEFAAHEERWKKHLRARDHDIDALWPETAYGKDNWGRCRLYPKHAELGISCFFPKEKAKFEEHASDKISRHCENVMTMVNVADRVGGGQFMWLCYNSGYHWNSDKRKPGLRIKTPSRGAFAATLTTAAARKLILKGIRYLRLPLTSSY